MALAAEPVIARKRDDEFVGFLVRQAINQWYTQRCLPRIGESLARETTPRDSTVASAGSKSAVKRPPSKRPFR